jgi:hypothetical protein
MGCDEKMSVQLVTASEIAAFAYCPEQWRLEYGLGLKPENQAAMVAGTHHHRRKAVAERVAASSITLGRFLVILVAPMLLLLLWWWSGRKLVSVFRGGNWCQSLAVDR